ncbi:MAG: hypothetical protein OEY56_07785, partial [Cyclobacteriaceae bacterium]|nr:hypothetical protein [Cyclobacteriaceae bacterium]
MNRTFRLIVFFLGSLTAVACRPEPPGYDLHQQDSHTSALLIGLSVIDDEVAWASGTDATILRTIDGGGNWEVFRYEEADTLQFRDIHAFSSQEAVVLSVGNGGASQVFRFDVDSGWTRTFQMDDDRGFLDAFDFWPDGQGLAYGDSFDEKPYLLKTEDMGATWFRLAGSLLPDAGPGEGGFASSGTCVETGADGKAWVGTGAGGNARLFFTPDYGDHWEILSTDMVTGEAAGITSVRFD